MKKKRRRTGPKMKNTVPKEMSKNGCRFLLHRYFCVLEDFQSECSEMNKAKDTCFAFWGFCSKNKQNANWIKIDLKKTIQFPIFGVSFVTACGIVGCMLLFGTEMNGSI
jgi:hypothetical protein